MSEKITWKMILSDFKERHPKLGKDVVYWCPHDFLTILIYLEGGMKITYNYFNHKATILTSRWGKN